ncbi:MAG: PA14 domain-containing protein [Planctomycetota bacterium]|nr:PA14 domain-containing protein [Planctomycetota bacterium]
MNHAFSRSVVRRGSVVITVIIALIVLQLVVVSITVSGARDQDVMAKRVEAARAFYAAEAGAAMAMREIATNVDEDSNGSVGGVAAYSSGTLTTAPVIASTSGLITTIQAVGANGAASRTVAASITRTATSGRVQGLWAEMWVMSVGLSQLSNIPWTTAPNFAGLVPNVNIVNQGSVLRNPGGPTGRYGIRFRGTITVPQSGVWTFSTNSDDGSDLWINGTRVVNNDGLHGATTRTGTINLNAGDHEFEVRFFENGGSSNCTAFWSGPGVPATTIIPVTAFTCEPPTEWPALAAATSIMLTGTSGGDPIRIDGFDSGAGLYGGSNILMGGYPVSLNSTSSSTWTQSSQAEIYANALVGPGGSPSSVISVSPPAVLSGSRGNLTTRALMMINGLPSNIPGVTGVLNISSATTINSNRRHSAITMSGAGVLTISGHVIIVVDGNVSMTGNSAIQLAANSSLTMYVSGNFTMDSDSALNANTQVPSRVRIYMTSPSGTPRTFSMDWRARAYAMVENPFGGFSFVGSSNANQTPHFYGTYRGMTFSANRRGWFHADIGADSIGGGSSPGTHGSITVADWSLAP